MKKVDEMIALSTVREARARMLEQGYGGKYISDKNLERLLKICGDPDLLATALNMDPRPQWVEDTIR